MRFDHAEFTSAIGAEDVSEEKVSEESEPVKTGVKWMRKGCSGR